MKGELREKQVPFPSPVCHAGLQFRMHHFGTSVMLFGQYAFKKTQSSSCRSAMDGKKSISENIALNLPSYNPGKLLDWIKQQKKVKDDASLARQLKISRPVVDGLRQGRLPLSATLSLAIAQTAGITLDELRQLVGDRRAKFRLASVRCA